MQRSIPQNQMFEQHFFFRFDQQMTPKPNHNVQLLAGNLKLFQNDKVSLFLVGILAILGKYFYDD